MVCYKPRDAKLGLDSYSGKKGVVFLKLHEAHEANIKIPCGQCIGCRLDRAKEWTVRCMLEAQLHERNSFLTLTYSPEFLPEGGTLVMSHVSDFVKRFRSAFPDIGISVYACGEYGDQLGRPHYHLCFFGYDFSDCREFKYRTELGHSVYSSHVLDDLWGMGMCEIGSLTPQSAGYVARYVTKKVTGKSAQEHYGDRVPEGPAYISKKPAIGLRWFERFSSDVYSNDFILIEGKKFKVPRYFDKKYAQLVSEETFAMLKEKRKLSGELRSQQDEQMDSEAFDSFSHLEGEDFVQVLSGFKTRSQVKEQCQLLKLGRLNRRYDSEVRDC